MSGTDPYAGRLNEFLDRLVCGEPEPGDGIDAVAAATIERLLARDDAPPPPPGLADQVWATVMNAAVPPPPAPRSSAEHRTNGNGTHAPVVRQPIPVSIWTAPVAAARSGRAGARRRGWPSGLAHATTVLLLVATLGLGFLALALQRDIDPAENAPGGVVPAPTHPSVDLSNAETLLSLTLPPDLLPQTAERGVSPVTFVVQPGTTGEWSGTRAICCAGVRVDYVAEGEYTVLANGPIDVRWADGREETIPSGTEIVLGPGDRMIVPEDVGFTNANNGDVPVHVIGWYVHEGRTESAQSAGNWSNNRWHTTLDLPPDAGGLTLELRRVRLAPGTDVPAAGSAQFAVSLDPMASLGEQSDGSIRNAGKTETTVYVLTASVDSSDSAPTHPAVDMAGAETLLTLTLPPELLPQSPERGVTRSAFTIHPGTSGRWEGISKTCCPGVRVDYVVEGEYTVNADGPIDVRRMDGSEETIPSGTEFVLGPGDRMIVPEGVGFDNANNGDVPVQVVGWYLYRGNWMNRTSINWWNDISWEWTTPLPAQPGPVTLQLDRVQLAPGVDVPASSGSIQFVVSLEESARLGQQSDGSHRNVGNSEITAYILTAATASSDPPADAIGSEAQASTPASTEPDDETLVTLTLPEEVFADGDGPRRAGLFDVTVPPGTEGAYHGADHYFCCPGTLAVAVVQGQVTILADGPVQVVRVGGREESIPANTELTLERGDALVVPRMTSFTNKNTGSEPARVIGFTIYRNQEKNIRIAENWIAYYDNYNEQLLPEQGDVEITIRRTALSAEASVSIASGSAQYVVGDSLEAMLGKLSDGSVRNEGNSEITVYVLTAATASSDGAVPDSDAPATESSMLPDGDTLLSLTLPNEVLPDNGEAYNAWLVEITVPPGTQGVWEGSSGRCCFGVRVEYVLAGSYTVRPDGPIQVLRADGREERIAAGTEAVLWPGDTMTVPYGTGYANANTGETPVNLLGWYIYAGSDSTVWMAANWEHPSGIAWAPLLEATALALRMTRITLPTGASLPDPGDQVRFIATLDRTAMLGQQSDGTIRNVGDADVTVYLLTMDPAAAP